LLTLYTPQTSNISSSNSAGYIISAIFICWEYQRLGIHHRQHRVLRISFWIKLAFIFVELGLAIAFGVLSDKRHYNSAAVVEWVISLIYAFYVWSFAIDFLPAVRTKHYASKETELEMGMAMEGKGAIRTELQRSSMDIPMEAGRGWSITWHIPQHRGIQLQSRHQEISSVKILERIVDRRYARYEYFLLLVDKIYQTIHEAHFVTFVALQKLV
jgi:hypothetical protein